MVRVFLLLFAVVFANSANARVVDQSIMQRLINHKSLTTLIKEQPIEIRKEIVCLALNAYFEARSSTILDQIATGFVVKNRTEVSYRGGDTICKTVWKWRQFEWTLDGKSDFPKEPEAWRLAQHIAFMVYFSKEFDLQDPTNGKLHYVRYDYVQKTEWAKAAIEKQRIGAHIYLTLR